MTDSASHEDGDGQSMLFKAYYLCWEPFFPRQENESLHCISVQIHLDTKLMAYYMTDDVESFSLP